MTIEKAREILGKEALNKSDKEIEQILNVAFAFCDVVIEKATELYKEGGKYAVDAWGKN